MSDVAPFPGLSNGTILSRHCTIYVKNAIYSKKASVKSQHTFYRKMFSGFQEEDWKHIQLQKQKFLGEHYLVKSLVVIPQLYDTIAVLLVCRSVEMFLDTSSGSHCKKRFIMPLNKARRFGKYN